MIETIYSGYKNIGIKCNYFVYTNKRYNCRDIIYLLLHKLRQQ